MNIERLIVMGAIGYGLYLLLENMNTSSDASIPGDTSGLDTTTPTGTLLDNLTGDSSIQLDANGLAFIQQNEALKLNAYQDQAGVWTIGYGHTEGVTPGMSITRDQALQFLAADTATAQSAVNSLVKVPLNQNQYNALVDFVFNEGTGHFANSTLLSLLNSGNYNAAAQQFSVWNIAAGKVNTGLVNRRTADFNLFSSGANT